MEGIGELPNEQFGVGFGAYCEIPTGVVSLVIVESGSTLSKTKLEGMFKDPPRRSLGRR